MEQQMAHQRIRFEMLIGTQGLARLRRARVAVFGLGGVGGAVVEALARAGIGALDLIDNDRIALSNLNRQIIALHSTLGMRKVDVAAMRVRDIDPDILVRSFQTFYLPESREQFDFRDYDYVVDCIDTVTAKLDLIMQCRAVGTPIICALGTGNKLDPSRLELADISKTAVCPLARVLRRELRRRGVTHLQVLYSREEPLTPLFAPAAEPSLPTVDPPASALDPTQEQSLLSAQAAEEAAERFGNQRRSIPGSSPFVPPVAGLMLASAVVRALLEQEAAPGRGAARNAPDQT